MSERQNVYVGNSGCLGGIIALILSIAFNHSFWWDCYISFVDGSMSYM